VQNCSGALENGKIGVQVHPSGSQSGGTNNNVNNGGGSSGSIVGTPTTTSGGDVTPSESSFKLSTKSAPTTLNSNRRLSLAEIEDLIHLFGPLTEDALIRCLQARCAASKYYVSGFRILDIMCNTILVDYSM